MLDDVPEGTVGVADYAPVAGRVVYHGGNDGGGIAALVMLYVSLSDSVGVHEGSVAAEYHYVAALSLQKGAGHHDRVACAKTLALVGCGNGVGEGREVLLGYLLFIPGDNAYILYPRLAHGVDDPLEHGLIEHLVHRLRDIRFHSLSLAPGEDDSAFVHYDGSTPKKVNGDE